ncbi:MAG: hypothetical protein HY716_16160 [Planctomycetes bacterium]|nr:hypothetical protein [Planctomycetota bacterium]
MAEKVFIAAVGARTAAGAGAAASAATVRAALSIVAEHPYLIDKTGQKMRVAAAPYLAEDLPCLDRLAELAVAAAREAAAALAGRKWAVPLLLGLPPARPGRPADLERLLAERLKNAVPEAGPFSSIKTISTGHASGLASIEEGWRAVASGAAAACLAGGVDSYIDPDTLDWLEDQDQLHSETCTWGFGPGEGAGFCLLISERTAKTLNIAPRLAILGAASSLEKNRIKTDAVCIGEGLTLAVRGALTGLPSPHAKIDQMYCDMNGEPYRVDELGFMLARVGDRFAEPSRFLAPADCWGDVGAASGPLFVTLADAASRKGYARGPHALLWASSEGGERAALLLGDITGVPART